MDIWFGLVLVSVRDVTHTHEHDLGHALTHALLWEVLDQAAADSHQVFSTIFQQTVVERGAIVRCVCVYVFVSVCGCLCE